MTQDYPRPELTPIEIEQAKMVAQNLAFRMSRPMKARIILEIVIENMRLLKECNHHRQFRGIDPLPVFTPKG